MSDKSKQRARSLRRKTGMPHQAAHNQLSAPPPARISTMMLRESAGPALLVDADGVVVAELPIFEPRVEVLSVERFDPTEFSKILVGLAPSPPGKRPPRPITLTQHIADVERRTGWKLMEVRPAPDLDRLLAATMPPPAIALPERSTIRLYWDDRTANGAVAR